MKKLDWLHWTLLAAIIVLGFYLWLGPYRYDLTKMGDSSVFRMDRLTGRMWMCGVAKEGAVCLGPIPEKEYQPALTVPPR